MISGVFFPGPSFQLDQLYERAWLWRSGPHMLRLICSYYLAELLGLCTQRAQYPLIIPPPLKPYPIFIER